MSTITPNMAVKRMRELTNVGVPFSFEFVTYSKVSDTSRGKRVVNRALLRKSYRKDQSKLHAQLIAYTDIDTGDKKQFHLPLLTKFNDYTIKP